jgi:hypothetical protein
LLCASGTASASVGNSAVLHPAATAAHNMPRSALRRSIASMSRFLPCSSFKFF